MENAVEALKNAAWVLVFVVALSLCINSFTEARQTMDTILDYNDREYDDYTSIKGSNDTQREVGYESIIPTIYRAYKENYKIIFKGIDKLYQMQDSNGNWVDINTIDLEQYNIGNSDELKEAFIVRVLFGNDAKTAEEEKKLKDYKSNFINYEFGNGIYNYLQGNNFKESLGEYYQEEAGKTEPSSVPELNKTKKRVITYEKMN